MGKLLYRRKALLLVCAVLLLFICLLFLVFYFLPPRPFSSSPFLFSEVPVEKRYILNFPSTYYHTPDCPYASQISIYRLLYFQGDRDVLLEQGYLPCPFCNP